MSLDLKTILVVDDDAKILKAISLRLSAAGYRVLTAYNGVEALALAQMKKTDLIIADIWMPVGMGFSLAYRLRQSAPEIPVIFLTASKQANLRAMADEFGAAAFIEKPYEPEELLSTIAGVLHPPVPVIREKKPASIISTDHH